jgi:hypothetical protein
VNLTDISQFGYHCECGKSASFSSFQAREKEAVEHAASCTWGDGKGMGTLNIVFSMETTKLFPPTPTRRAKNPNSRHVEMIHETFQANCATCRAIRALETGR